MQHFPAASETRDAPHPTTPHPSTPPPPTTQPAVVDHDTQLVRSSPDWLPPLDGCGEDEREGLWRLMQARGR